MQVGAAAIYISYLVLHDGAALPFRCTSAAAPAFRRTSAAILPKTDASLTERDTASLPRFPLARCRRLMFLFLLVVPRKGAGLKCPAAAGDVAAGYPWGGWFGSVQAGQVRE